MLYTVPVPRRVLLCAAATLARESEKISAAIRTDKLEAVFITVAKHIKLP
jgi:hypothetical protein